MTLGGQASQVVIIQTEEHDIIQVVVGGQPTMAEIEICVKVAKAAPGRPQVYSPYDLPPELRTELIERHLGLVDHIVERVKFKVPAHVDADDLRSVGVMGLIRAVESYHPERDRSFKAYLSIRIHGAIQDELRRLDFVPRRLRKRVNLMKVATMEVEQLLQRPATDTEIRDHLSLTPVEFARWKKEAEPVTFVPLDRQTDNEDGAGVQLHELIMDEDDETGIDSLHHDEMRAMLAKKMMLLPEVDRKVLALYYFDRLRFAQIAEIFDLTESRICQIHGACLVKLRRWFNEAMDK